MAVLGFLLCTSSLAYAQDPDILGTWKGASSATVIGANEHFDTERGSSARFLKTEFTLVIDRAEGRSFSGRVSSGGEEEPLVGAFRADLLSGVMADYDGTYSFELTAPDKLELCYHHAASATGRSLVAACNELDRQ
ncbi:hypothetical protein [Spiribacter onubensis]